MTPAWPPDQSTQLLIAFVVIALLALALILMFVHFKGGIKAAEAKATDLFHGHASAIPPAPPVIHVAAPVIDQAQLDAAVAKALAAHGVLGASAPTAAAIPPWGKP